LRRTIDCEFPPDVNRHAVWQIHDNVVARLVGAAVYGYPWDAGYSKESWESESVELEFEETGIENSESHDTENGSSQDAAKNEICAVQETDLCIDPRWRVRISWDLPTQHRRSDCFTGYYRNQKSGLNSKAGAYDISTFYESDDSDSLSDKPDDSETAKDDDGPGRIVQFPYYPPSASFRPLPRSIIRWNNLLPPLSRKS